MECGTFRPKYAVGRAKSPLSESEEEGDEGNTEDEDSDDATWDGSSEEWHWSGADSTGTE